MENRTTTFYAVRVIRHFVNSDRAPEVFWVRYDDSYGQGARNWSLGTQEKATRWIRKGKAKLALKYACVREALERTRVRDHETAEKVKAKKGKNYYHNPWIHYPTIKVRHEAEAVRLTERITYDEPEVIDSLPRRSALEQIARQADDCTIYYSLCP